MSKLRALKLPSMIYYILHYLLIGREPGNPSGISGCWKNSRMDRNEDESWQSFAKLPVPNAKVICVLFIFYPQFLLSDAIFFLRITNSQMKPMLVCQTWHLKWCIVMLLCKELFDVHDITHWNLTCVYFYDELLCNCCL